MMSLTHVECGWRSSPWKDREDRVEHRYYAVYTLTYTLPLISNARNRRVAAIYQYARLM